MKGRAMQTEKERSGLGSADKTVFQLPPDCPRSHCPAIEYGKLELERLQRTEAGLESALAREQLLLMAKEELLRQKELLARESDHRLLNGLQMAASLLSVQSRKTTDREAAAQLRTAANRVMTVARVHHRLHVLDHMNAVNLNDYLPGLSAEIAVMLAQDGSDKAIAFDGVKVTVPSSVGTPLAFIVSELIINSAKHGASQIAVSLQKDAGRGHCIKVADNGPGLPEGFDPLKGKGLGMTIVSTLVRQIGGELDFGHNASGKGACVTVFFG
jgi:two-component sensor histidine kinase